MSNKIIKTGLGRTSDGELIVEPRMMINSLTYELNSEVQLLDEWDTGKYIMARYVVTINNDLGMVELNEFIVFITDQGPFLRFLATLNNLTSASDVSALTVELARGYLQLKIQGTGRKNIVRFSRTLYPL